MGPTAGRRLGALITTAAVLASLSAVTVSSTASAAKPRCDGKVATIVSRKTVIRGTNRADIIVALGSKDNRIYGRGGRDRICAGAGEDKVYGGPGNDRLFGGSGYDRIYGQNGRDDLFGFRGGDHLDGGAQADYLDGGIGVDDLFGQGGPDILKGGAGNDLIFGEAGDDKLYGQVGDDDLDGGDGTDLCVQGPGAGEVHDCEDRIADLSVEVIAPAQATEGTVDVTVKVTNNGPEAASYVLELDRVDGDANCDRPPASTHYPVLAATQSRSHDVSLDCVIEGPDPGLTVIAEVIADGTDTVPGNNLAQNERTILVPAA
jgi:hypothetical protein